MIHPRQKNKAFTLIELLVVISIIGLLSSIIFASLGSARSKSRDASRKLQLRQILLAVTSYYYDNGTLPRNGSGWCTTISNPSNGWGSGFQSDISPKYISSVPFDPTIAGQIGDYFYSNDDNANGKFTLCATLENSTGAIYNYTGCSNGTIYNYCISSK